MEIKTDAHYEIELAKASVDKQFTIIFVAIGLLYLFQITFAIALLMTVIRLTK